ncbi:MAG: PKD domain-containing protein [Bacteroidia bacterium]|jgi:PKD repeat protein|nr:PKD domain-containing protein [Bacteroidia bacterium]
MTRNILFVILFLGICFGGIQLIPAYTFKRVNKPQQKVPKRDRMDLAWAQEIEMTKDPKTGEVPKERLMEAYAYMQEIIKGRWGKAAIAGVNWQERGPNNCGGRTRSICVDLNDVTGKTIWAGSVAGGLWKTTDITASQPNWTNTNEFFDNMAITTITQAPKNPQVMYFGTGEGNGNLDAVRGLGVWKSSNGGTNWSQLSATNNSNFHFIQKILAIGGGDTLFVCARSGLWRTINGGTTFTRVLGSGISSAAGNEAEDIEIMANGTLYASMANTTGSIHKSFNFGATWTNPLTISGNILRREIELAVSTADTNVIWGLVENGGTIRTIIRSSNAGATFDTTMAYPNDADPGIPDTDFSRGQAWYDLSIAADPNNSNVCWVGGIDLFKTTNGGTSWSQMSHWYGGFGFQEVHADQHFALFAPGSSTVMYFGNDGGVYRTANANAAMPTISVKEINYNTTQFYACDIHPQSGNNYFLAGSQDNGSHRFNTTGINSTVEVTGGDGAFCHIDQSQPAFQFTSYVYNSYYRSTNGGNSFSGTGLTFGTRTGRFINPTDYDDSLNMMYAAYGNGTFMRWNNPQTGNSSTIVTVSALNNIMVSAVTVSPNNPRRLYLGTSSGRVVRVDNCDTVTSPLAGVHINSGVAGMPTSGYVNCIEVEKGNESHIIIVFSNYGVNSVWETRNGGTTWSNCEGNLPDMPIRWALMSPFRPHQVLLATELGVWSTDSLRGTATDWQPSNTGLSNTRTDMLKMRWSDYLVIAATHGRGLYSSDVFAIQNPNPIVSFTVNRNIAYPQTNLQFTNTTSSVNQYLWNFGDGTTSTLANPVKSYTLPGVYNVTLTVNNGTGTLTKNNYIHILPYRGVPYTAANGGNFDINATDFAAESLSGTPWERGSSSVAGKNGTVSGSFAWVTGLVGNYVDNSESYLYSPSFNCGAAGNYTLSFQTKFRTESTWDGFRVEYSTNHGATWQILGNSILTNWYNYANPNNDRPFPQNEAFFSSGTTMTNFAVRSLTTNVFQGNSTVTFRIAFKSDVSVPEVGIAIDNFELNGPNNQPLPVTWGSFKLKRLTNESAQLNWETYSEKNNAGFEIHKQDHTGNWMNIGFVAGKGNSTLTNQYQFIDQQAGKQVAFYRIKQLDKDGKADFSEVMVLAPLAESTSETMKLATLGNAQFKLLSNDSNNGYYWLYQSNGSLIKNGTLNSSDVEFNLQGYPQGIYYLHVVVNGKQQVIKVPLLGN